MIILTSFDLEIFIADVQGNDLLTRILFGRVKLDMFFLIEYFNNVAI